MLFATTGNEERRVEQVLTAQELQAMQRLVRQIPVPDKVVEAILRLVRSARPGTGAGAETDRLIAWGPGPRASQALMLAVRAKALIDGRLAPSVDDVIALAEPILKHRMALTFAARAEGRDGQRRHQSPDSSSRVSRVAARGSARATGRRGRRLQARRRGTCARRPPSRFAVGVAQGRQHGGARHPRPPPRRHRRDVLAVPAVPGRRPGDRDRLAPLGQLRHALRARARMGGLAHVLALARRVAVHDVPQPSGPGREARPRPRADAGRGRDAGARRRARRAAGAHAAARQPQGHHAPRRGAGRQRGLGGPEGEPAAQGAPVAASPAPSWSATSSIRRRRSSGASTRWRRTACRGT